MIKAVQVNEPYSDAQIEIKESGVDSETVVILVHGSLDRASGMAKVASLVGKFCRVIRFDRRGYGQHWNHPGPFTVEGNVDDIEFFLRGRSAVVIGHSYGGQVALACATRLGSQVRGISVFETPLSWMPWWPAHTAGGASVAAGPQHAAETFMIRMIGEQRWRQLPEKTKEARRREGTALVSELSALRQSPSWTPESVTCPVIVGVGSRAQDHHHKGAQWLTDQLPRSSFVVIDGAPHGAHLSHPQEFVELLVRPHCDVRGTFTEMS